MALLLVKVSAVSWLPPQYRVVSFVSPDKLSSVSRLPLQYRVLRFVIPEMLSDEKLQLLTLRLTSAVQLDNPWIVFRFELPPQSNVTRA